MDEKKIKNLQKSYEENLKSFQGLISAQDFVRRVYCYQSQDSEIDKELKRIDKLLTNSINYFGEKIGGVTGEAKKIWPV